MIARTVALAVCLAVALTGAPAADADAAGRKGKRTPVCKTKKASKKAARQAKRKRRCRPQARHLRKRTVKARRPAAAPAAPVLPLAPAVLPITDEPAAPPAVPAAPAPVAEVDPTCGPSRNLGATAEDAGGFRLRLTRTCVPAGEVFVNWQNTDSSEHDLWAMPLAGTAGTAQQIIAAMLTTEMPVYGDVTVTAGRWELFCSLDGHGAMRATVTVTP